MICFGTNRVVWLIGKYAIKFPRLWGWRYGIHGILANYHEKDLWEAANTKGSLVYEDRERLAPVKWISWGGLVLCMARTEPYEGAFPEFVSEYVPIDPNPDNIGLYEGRVVLHDYGPLILSNGMFANLRDPD